MDTVSNPAIRRCGPAIRSSLPMHRPRTVLSQTMHPSIYSSSRTSSLWIHPDSPQLMLSSLFFRNGSSQSPFQSPLYHPGSPSQALCLPQLFSHLLRTALADLMTWREQTCVCTLCQRKSSTELPRTQGRVKMHESAAGTVI